MNKEIKEYSKKEILEALNTDNRRPGNNSMGASESWYNPFYMVGEFLKDQEMNPEDISEEMLKMLLMLATFSADIFY